MLHSGVITHGEAALLDRWFITMTNTSITGMEVDMIVYIRTDPDILMERINHRGRQVFCITFPRLSPISSHQLSQTQLQHPPTHQARKIRNLDNTHLTMLGAELGINFTSSSTNPPRQVVMMITGTI